MSESEHDQLLSAKIDVIILCSGTAEYFESTLKAVLAQTEPPTAIYVVDNGCDHPRYLEIAQSENSKIIHYVKFEKRLRMTANWQRCLVIGDSPYFVCLHDDDLWDIEAISRAKKILTSDPTFSACLLGHAPFRSKESDDDRSEILNKRQKDLAFVNDLNEPLRSFILSTANLGHMCALFCKRIPICYPIQNSYMPDQGFLSNHAAYGRIAMDPKVSVHIRLHDKSVTSSYSGNSRSAFEMVSQIRNILMFQIENAGLKSAHLAEISQHVPYAYLFRILQACHSWPLRPSLLAFGRDLMSAKPFRGIHTNRFEFRKYLGPTGWVITTLAADAYYSYREENLPN